MAPTFGNRYLIALVVAAIGTIGAVVNRQWDLLAVLGATERRLLTSTGRTTRSPGPCTQYRARVSIVCS